MFSNSLCSWIFLLIWGCSIILAFDDKSTHEEKVHVLEWAIKAGLNEPIKKKDDGTTMAIEKIDFTQLLEWNDKCNKENPEVDPDQTGSKECKKLTKKAYKLIGDMGMDVLVEYLTHKEGLTNRDEL